jgi:uncharacterized protein YaiL (DUF2058 family)
MNDTEKIQVFDLLKENEFHKERIKTNKQIIKQKLEAVFYEEAKAKFKDLIE